MDLNGIIACSHYSFRPNYLKYCGPDKNRQLFEYGAHNAADGGLANILSEFETLYPYLKFIAFSNKILDPFDRHVIEAYWIGNSLLENIRMSKFYNHLAFDQNLKKRLNAKSFEYLVGKIPQGAKPHHSFHVFNVFMRTGHYAVEHTIVTMDKCRISWGKVLEIKDDHLIVLSQPLEMKNKKICFGQGKKEKIFWKREGKSFIKNLKIGDWVSIHWDWACERLTPRQVQNLRYYTTLSLKLVNLTI